MNRELAQRRGASDSIQQAAPRPGGRILGGEAPFPALRGDQRFTTVATDLDGTLLRTDRTISPATRSALDQLHRTGIRHIIVTGRPASGCGVFLAELSYRGLAVCGQGGQLYDADAHEVIWSTTLDRDVALDIVDRTGSLLGRLEVGVGTAGLGGRLLCTRGFCRPPDEDVHDTTDVGLLWGEPIEKLLLRHPSGDGARLCATVERVCGSRATVVLSNPYTVEVLPSGVDKGAGLARAAAWSGFAADQTIAFGDMPNDIPMFEWAGYAVAMGNAPASVRAVADEVAPTNDEDGVAKVLNRVLALRP